MATLTAAGVEGLEALLSIACDNAVFDTAGVLGGGAIVRTAVLVILFQDVMHAWVAVRA
ncbi:hypothetical protein LTR91_020509 [Friedmanniomyces endolithicus]|uniref:Uncharacterized protein n=1 Tax=Friedmanniomyces endolithicus TaxID=329885 RepID=A0AAN6K3S4_9PEZI|nr:hypothetical protein LTR01_008854 [Friedmanniomyces endolithicus]KAK0822995.1 hypothetical protein LTR73_008858 [Friedmanniomyces endolithicus]KAK0897946.1 hypothetical protein LTR57_021856 [Friedmanniomyces endolithicus]KAK0959131.1 hypothetical protein LTS01_021522 [Friedmanniomyces endolithicus]KAK0960107.1 hypothetical protein LTR91_020509 [Friedmanniomyces endolithicus]